MNLQIPVFLPSINAKISQQQRKENAAQFRDLLVDLLTEHGPLTAAQLVAMTGSKLSTVREYMSKLANEGRAASQRVAVTGRGAGWIAMYSVGDGLPPLKGEQAKQKTVTEYPLHHKRDFLVACFFGPAKQQHGELTK